MNYKKYEAIDPNKIIFLNPPDVSEFIISIMAATEKKTNGKESKHFFSFFFK